MANEVYTSFNISASKNSNTVTSGSQGVTGTMVGSIMSSSNVTIIGSGSTATAIPQVAGSLFLYVKNDDPTLIYEIYTAANTTGIFTNLVCTLNPAQFVYLPKPSTTSLFIRCTTVTATGTAFVVSIS